MEEQVFFIINGNVLTLDKVLVEFNEAPIFFVCTQNDKYYISSCTDIEKEKYIVTEVSLSNLSRMLHGKITMRDLILQADCYWDITVGEDVEKDIVLEKEIRTISLEDLPYEGAYLEVTTKELVKYVEWIDSLLYDNGTWEKQSSQMFDEYTEIDMSNILGRYEIMLQDIYESEIREINKQISNIVCQDADYSRLVCSAGFLIDEQNNKPMVIIDRENKRAFAA